MRCPSCGSENPEGTKFCIECGVPFKNRCPSCGVENLSRAKFCGECGAPLTIKAKGKSEKISEAEEWFRQAIDVARRQSAKFLELRAVMSLSRLLQKRGKKKKARQMLAEIYGWFTEGFDTADLKEAKVLLEDLA